MAARGRCAIASLRPQPQRGSSQRGGRLPPCACAARPALKVSDLSYRPTGASHLVLDGVSLELRSRTLGLITGPSGSGKSTLLQVLAGFATGYSGSLALDSAGDDGHDSVGVVFQFPERHFVGKTIFDELSFGWCHSNDLATRAEFVRRMPGTLALAGLADQPLESKLSEFSGGYQRRVAVAVQLLRRPSVLLLDEPTAGMDAASCDALCETLAAVKDTSAVLVVSHDQEYLLRIADDVWEMKSGGQLIKA